LKKAGENFALGWALPNPPGALPLDPFGNKENAPGIFPEALMGL